MKKLGLVAASAFLLGLVATPVSAQAPPSGWDSWTSLFDFSGCGGNEFATCMSVDVRYTGTIVGVRVLNDGGPGVFTRVAIVNLGGYSASAGTSSTPSGVWEENTDGGLNGGGIPGARWAWIAPEPTPFHGLSVGEFGYFTFVVSDVAAIDRIGAAVHAQVNPLDDCSTKFGVWQDGDELVTNDVGLTGYDPACIGTSVPEPSSMALLATGLAGIAFVGRRRRTTPELVDEEGDEIG